MQSEVFHLRPLFTKNTECKPLPLYKNLIRFLNIVFNLNSLSLLFRLRSIIRCLQANPGFASSSESLISFKENCCQVNVGHAPLCPTYRVDPVRQYDNQIDVDRYIIG